MPNPLRKQVEKLAAWSGRKDSRWGCGLLVVGFVLIAVVLVCITYFNRVDPIKWLRKTAGCPVRPGLQFQGTLYGLTSDIFYREGGLEAGINNDYARRSNMLDASVADEKHVWRNSSGIGIWHSGPWMEQGVPKGKLFSVGPWHRKTGGEVPRNCIAMIRVPLLANRTVLRPDVDHGDEMAEITSGTVHRVLKGDNAYEWDVCSGRFNAVFNVQ